MLAFVSWQRKVGRVDGLSIQERFFAGLTCFGCGPANEKGLRLRSYPIADGSLADGTHAEFVPWPEHDNGLGYLNGGIICTVLDCHSATPMVLEAERLGLTADSALPYVTAGLDVRYLRPTPLTRAQHTASTHRVRRRVGDGRRSGTHLRRQGARRRRRCLEALASSARHLSLDLWMSCRSGRSRRRRTDDARCGRRGAYPDPG